jgi:hypothetical protein
MTFNGRSRDGDTQKEEVVRSSSSEIIDDVIAGHNKAWLTEEREGYTPVEESKSKGL